MKTVILLVLLFLIPPGWSAPLPPPPGDNGTAGLNYRFSYLFRMEMQGKIMLVVPYRFYHEASAAVNLRAGRKQNGDYEFCYTGVDRTGYVMTTGGLTGTSLYFFTADYDLERAVRFREERIRQFLLENPYYAAKIKKIRRRPMKILSAFPEAIRFSRDSRGIHTQPAVMMHLTDSHSNTYSNIYPLLGALLMSYNHSFLPPGRHGPDRLKRSGYLAWDSPPLDFSKPLTRAARLTSAGAEKRAHFKQKETFTLHYHIISANNGTLEICGEGYPEVTVWKDMKIRHTLRKITLRLEDGVVIEDRFFLDFRDEKGMGGTVALALELTGK
jgi:hypothetical protein